MSLLTFRIFLILAILYYSLIFLRFCYVYITSPSFQESHRNVTVSSMGALLGLKPIRIAYTEYSVDKASASVESGALALQSK